MTEPVSNVDFREAAVAESQALLAQRCREMGKVIDPVEAGVSYCLPSGQDGAAALRRIKRIQILGLVGGFAGLGTGGLIAFLAERNPAYDTWRTLAVAGASSLTGFALLFYGVLAPRPLVRRYVRERLGDAWPRGESAPIHVGIEDSRTYQKLKAMPDDVGVLILHTESRCLQVEGLSHRYLIYADDVIGLNCSMTEYTEGISIEYRIGEQSLALTIVPGSLVAAFKRQTIGGRSRLHERIRATLAPRDS